MRPRRVLLLATYALLLLVAPVAGANDGELYRCIVENLDPRYACSPI